MSEFRIPESVAISDSGFLFHAATGETFTMNEIGREIFKLLQSGEVREKITQKIQQEYDVEGATLHKDLEDFVNQLRSFKLITQQ